MTRALNDLAGMLEDAGLENDFQEVSPGVFVAVEQDEESRSLLDIIQATNEESNRLRAEIIAVLHETEGA